MFLAIRYHYLSPHSLIPANTETKSTSFNDGKACDALKFEKSNSEIFNFNIGYIYYK